MTLFQKFSLVASQQEVPSEVSQRHATLNESSISRSILLLDQLKRCCSELQLEKELGNQLNPVIRSAKRLRERLGNIAHSIQETIRSSEMEHRYGLSLPPSVLKTYAHLYKTFSILDTLKDTDSKKDYFLKVLFPLVI